MPCFEFKKICLQIKTAELSRSLFFIAIILLITGRLNAQVAVDSTTFKTDTTSIIDSGAVSADTLRVIDSGDSISKRPMLLDSTWAIASDQPIQQQILARHPYFRFNAKPVSFRSDKKQFKGKEIHFYVVVALVMIFALLRLAFGKYVNDLFRVFFRTTLKQRQIRDQLMQTPLPSLAFNVFFVATAGMYLDFMLFYFNFKPVDNFWMLWFYCAVGLSVIYFVKFIGLKVCGWLFNMKAAADSYIFIVFIINKMIGIFVLPFLVLLAFSEDPLYSISLVISWAGIGALLFYRFILGFAAVRNEVKFNLFHFFLYLCAFEIAPLILIYRLLLLVF